MENFDELALTWDNEPRRVERAKVVADEIKKGIPCLSGMSGLEYGCGTGLLSFCLQPYLKEIVLADSSQTMLDVVKQKIEKTKLKKMAPVLLDLSVNAVEGYNFDIIYTLMALHHIVEIDRVIESFSRMLNPSGNICIADLDEEDGSFHGKGFTGHNGFNKNELIQKLAGHSFKNISWKICYQNIKKFEDGTERKYPLFLAIGEKG